MVAAIGGAPTVVEAAEGRRPIFDAYVLIPELLEQPTKKGKLFFIEFSGFGGPGAVPSARRLESASGRLI